MKKEDWLQLVKNVGFGALGGALGGIQATPAIKQTTETKTGDLLGKYKGWIIVGAILVGLSILASAFTIFSKKR